MEREQHKEHPMRTVLSAMTILVLAHLPLWLLRPYASLPQALFELDLLIAVAIFTRNRWVGGVAILLAWSVSLLRSVAVNYHFHNVAEFIDASRFVDMLSYSAFITPANLLVAAAMMLVVAVIFRCMALTRSKAWPVLALILLLGLLDVLNGSGITRGRDAPFIAVNIFGSPGYNLAAAERNFRRDARQAMAAIAPVPRSYQALRDEAQGEHQGSLLILVESLGVPQAPEIRAWLMGRLRTSALVTQWDLNEGEEAFVGGTVAGELRVLCGQRGHYSQLTEMRSQACLPRLFRARGDEAIAMHGFSPRMFDRAAWWPIAGFTQTRFADEWAARKSAHCDGAFNGICDRDLIASAIHLAGERRQFVYALTINTHLPLPPQKVSPELRALCQAHDVPDVACELLHAHGNFFTDLATQLAGSPECLRQVVVVGDHSPPFNDFRARRVFKPTQVPSLILRRRQGGAAGEPPCALGRGIAVLDTGAVGGALPTRRR
jgi:phosphoglycerol transferase MdoB-like AlkP superfamily enzyme